MARISLILVSGFLGAGKTTLLRRMLADPAWRARRAAFLVNDFADIGVDAQILQQDVRDGVTIAQLSSGCMCCTAKGEFETALRALIALEPETIVIETAGVTDPSAVMAALRNPRLRLDSIVCVIDAERFADYARLSSAVEFQVYTADVVLLNKADLATPEVLAQVAERIRTFNAKCAILPCVRCDAPLTALFGATAASAEAEFARRARAGKTAIVDEAEPVGGAPLQSVTLPLAGPIDEDALTIFFRSDAMRGVLRAKGFVRITGRRRALLNFVPRRYSLEESVSDEGETFLVFIGLALDVGLLTARLGALVEPRK
jgi:G3E family GTPase